MKLRPRDETDSADSPPYVAENGAPLAADEKDAALKIFEQKYNQFRHFDILRWQIPGLVGTLGVLISRFGTNDKGVVPPIVLVGYGAFALLCAYFLYRLILHIRTNTEVLQAIGRYIGDHTIPAPPIWYWSAAAWFAILMAVVGLFSLIVGAVGFFVKGG